MLITFSTCHWSPLLQVLCSSCCCILLWYLPSRSFHIPHCQSIRQTSQGNEEASAEDVWVRISQEEPLFSPTTTTTRTCSWDSPIGLIFNTPIPYVQQTPGLHCQPCTRPGTEDNPTSAQADNMGLSRHTCRTCARTSTQVLSISQMSCPLHKRTTAAHTFQWITPIVDQTAGVTITHLWWATWYLLVPGPRWTGWSIEHPHH